jgi:hypothetical protein
MIIKILWKIAVDWIFNIISKYEREMYSTDLKI